MLDNLLTELRQLRMKREQKKQSVLAVLEWLDREIREIDAAIARLDGSQLSVLSLNADLELVSGATASHKMNIAKMVLDILKKSDKVLELRDIFARLKKEGVTHKNGDRALNNNMRSCLYANCKRGVVSRTKDEKTGRFLYWLSDSNAPD